MRGMGSMERRSLRAARAVACALTVAVGALVLAPVAAAAQEAPDRGGFTLMLSVGYGVQHDGWYESTESGLAGMNFAIGGFLTDALALTARLSGTNVVYEVANERQVSGFFGPALQLWPNDRVSLEGGVGFGFWEVDGVNGSGLGVLLGASVVLYNSGKHNFQLGVEYAPAFTDPSTVHNIGFTVGWQLL